MLQAMVAQRCESIRRYEESGQLELAEREAEEIEVIKRFLPPQLGEAGLRRGGQPGDRRARRAQAQGHRARDLRAQASLSRSDGLRQGAPASSAGSSASAAAASGAAASRAIDDRRAARSQKTTRKAQLRPGKRVQQRQFDAPRRQSGDDG